MYKIYTLIKKIDKPVVVILEICLPKYTYKGVNIETTIM